MANTLYVAVYTSASTATWARGDLGNGRNGWSLTGYVGDLVDGTIRSTDGDETGALGVTLSAGTAYKLWAIVDDGSTSSTLASSGPFVAVVLSGQAVTASSGTLTPSVSIALSGQTVTASAGTLVPSITVALSGQAVTVSAGTVTATQGVTVALSGESVTASAGTLTNSTTIALSGQAVTASAGTITYSEGNNLTLALSGAEVTASAGSLVLSSTIAVSGQSASVETGSLAPNRSVALSGEALTASAGTLTYSADQSLTIALTGESVSVSAGIITVVGGQSATTQVGAPGPRRRTTYVAFINGKRFIGSLEEIQSVIDEFTQEQIETAGKTLKPPKKARIVVQAGKPANKTEKATEPQETLQVQADVRDYYTEAYEEALRVISKAIESAKLADDEDEETLMLFL